MSKRSTRLYITDILQAIDHIEAYTRRLSFDQFRQDAKTIDAVVRNIEIIGEAARHIPEDVRLNYPVVPWKQVVGARDKMIHEYFGVDLEIVWKTVN